MLYFISLQSGGMFPPGTDIYLFPLSGSPKEPFKLKIPEKR